MGSKRKRGASKTGANGGEPAPKHAKTSHTTSTEVLPTPDLDLEKTPFTETLASESRKREAKIYQLLGSADSDERIAAADALVTGLLVSPEAALVRHLDSRLFRGLASSRNASRLGFSLVLTEILAQLFGEKNLSGSKYPGITFDKALNILVERTTADNHVPGQEERDCYFGRLFGLQCFVESRILFTEESRWPQVLDLLLKMAEKKAWMRSHCGWIIVESLPQMGQGRAEETLRKLSSVGLGKTAEGVGIWTRALSCYPNLKTPEKPWRDPLSPSVIPEVARVLKENVARDSGEDAPIIKARQGGWNPQLHFVWDLILAVFGNGSGKETKDKLRLFWNTAIDDGLFSKTASDAQKFRGFLILQKFLQGFAADKTRLVKELFSRNLMKCLINQAAKEDRYLHRAALKSLQSIEKTVQAAPQLLMPILEELLGKHGAYDFDQRTSTKTVENLLQWVTPTDAKSVLKFLRSFVLTANGSDAAEIEKLRSVYAGYVSKMAVQAKPATEPSDKGEISNVAELGVKELAACAYSEQPQFKPSLSEKSREVFRRLLASTIGKVMGRGGDAEYLCHAVVSVEPTAVNMSEEIKTERDNALKSIRKSLRASKKTSGKDDGVSLGLALLYAITVLQLYDGTPDAVNILQDLQRCTEKMGSKEGGTSELLVEILLALVSRPSSMMRQISEQVFEAFTSQVSSEALELLTEPLFADENEKGYQALFENLEDENAEMVGDEDSDADEDDGANSVEISEVGSDVEFVSLNGEEANPDSGGESEDEDEDEDEAQAEGDAQELADFDAALAKVLRSHRLNQDNDAESSSGDSDMTDSEMMALNDKLVEVFKQKFKKTGSKKDRKDAKDSVIMFKHRVVDLLALYIKHEATNPLAFGLLPPLLEVVRTTTAKPLANKAALTIENFSKTFKKKAQRATAQGNGGDGENEGEMENRTSIDAEARLALMREIHRQAARDMSHAFGRAASAASLLVASSLLADGRGDDKIDGVNAVYAQTFADCQKGKTKLQGFFFSDWINWGMGHAANAKSLPQPQQAGDQA
ncbi:DNA polymerase phi-domain-containing protein [Durotheca rogersii]|uniref:DNA polymerase phi-domain-containing protein n=1 Tax=Durotheca rogersii TaxID=419775 RepID=UPI00222041C3|nr:DNA polymerase phi-domain-containing protein [Durotheca rogersii]KAI5861681.1 DNA polymerase phi-domain-containing protein [Durotheca rogersii]